jgi:lysophospholipase L1-like esterase
MAVLVYANSLRDSGLARLASVLGGNVDTDILDRGANRRAGLLVITSAVGGGPTVTVNILGTNDADQVAFRDVNLPFIKFNRNPFG